MQRPEKLAPWLTRKLSELSAADRALLDGLLMLAVAHPESEACRKIPQCKGCPMGGPCSFHDEYARGILSTWIDS